jgi:hypothetical protein
MNSANIDGTIQKTEITIAESLLKTKAISPIIITISFLMPF